jgi:hypothetical protein
MHNSFRQLVRFGKHKPNAPPKDHSNGGGLHFDGHRHLCLYRIFSLNQHGLHFVKIPKAHPSNGHRFLQITT